jgi:anti-sigma factor RsiW
MSHHNTEAVTGLLDGQLKGIRRWLVKRHVSACPVCAAEYRHQQHVRRMLQENPPVTAMGDSADFFWSKVKAEIQRRGDERVEAPVPRLALSDWLQVHQFAVATAAASLIAVVSLLWFVASFHGTPAAIVSAPLPADLAKVEQLKTAIPHAAATTFDSDDAGVTVIWVSGLPWTRDMNEMKTEFANLDT